MKHQLFEISPALQGLSMQTIYSILPSLQLAGCITLQISDIKQYSAVTRFKCTYDETNPVEDEYITNLHAYRFYIGNDIHDEYVIRNCKKFIPIETHIHEKHSVEYSYPESVLRHALYLTAPFVPNSSSPLHMLRYSPVPPEEGECLDKLAELLFEHSDTMKEGDYLQLMNYLKKKKTHTV